jgi:hypothetical protein
MERQALDSAFANSCTDSLNAMPRKGPAYGITKDWQDLVRDRIEKMKEAGEVKSQNEIAALAGIADPVSAAARARPSCTFRAAR